MFEQKTRSLSADNAFFNILCVRLTVARKIDTAAIEPNVSRCLEAWKARPYGRQPPFLVRDTLALPQLREIGAFQERPFYFHSEIVVAFVANDTDGQDMILVTQAFRNNMFNALRVGRVSFAENASHEPI